MEEIIMYVAAVLAVALIIYLLIKKMDIKISLFAIGIILMFIALLMGRTIDFTDFKSTGLGFLDPFKAIGEQFKSTLSSAGFIILILGGYSAYMTAIGANEVTVGVLTKPVKKIKSVYILVPIVFLLGNLLSLVIPSASNLAIILLATLFPVLKSAGMSTLTAAAVIATTATIVPTPLGSDNVAIAEELAKYPQYAGMTVSDYVFRYHAIISVPTLAVISFAHYFWQKFMDKKSGIASTEEEILLQDIKEINGGVMYRTVYALLPVLPILLLIAAYFIKAPITISVEVASIFSFIVAIICELIRNKFKKNREILEGTESFFKGMANGMSIVALLVAASIFVVGLKSIGLISALQETMVNTQGTGMGIILPILLVAVTVVIVLLSGSGTALFFAMVPLVMPLAEAAGISAIAVSIPMGLAGNLMRAVSPIAAVTVIVAGTVKRNPIELVKRTSVPMITGLVCTLILSFFILL